MELLQHRLQLHVCHHLRHLLQQLNPAHHHELRQYDQGGRQSVGTQSRDGTQPPGQHQRHRHHGELEQHVLEHQHLRAGHSRFAPPLPGRQLHPDGCRETLAAKGHLAHHQYVLPALPLLPRTAPRRPVPAQPLPPHEKESHRQGHVDVQRHLCEQRGTDGNRHRQRGAGQQGLSAPGEDDMRCGTGRPERVL